MTNKKDWVLDPFLGSGTSIISALRHGRKGVVAETNKKYIQIVCDRIKQFKNGSLKTRPMNTPVYDPKNSKETIRNQTLEMNTPVYDSKNSKETIRNQTLEMNTSVYSQNKNARISFKNPPNEYPGL